MSEFNYEVQLDGEPIKRFRSQREAKWFTEGKDNATIVRLTERKSQFQRNLDLFNSLDAEEALF